MAISFDVELRGTAATRVQGAFRIRCQRPQVGDGGIGQLAKNRREGQTAIAAERQVVQSPFSKSVCPEWAQLLVSTAAAICRKKEKAHAAKPGAVCGRKYRIM